MKIIGTTRALDDNRAAVRVEDVYDTDIGDLWQACTTPERLARWIAEVSGDLRVGGRVHAVFTSQIEAWLSTEQSSASRTRLVVEERGLPAGQAHCYGAGWQVHLEDLGRSLAADGPVHRDGWSERAAAPAWNERWTELTPAYRTL